MGQKTNNVEKEAVLVIRDDLNNITAIVVTNNKSRAHEFFKVEKMGLDDIATLF